MAPVIAHTGQALMFSIITLNYGIDLNVASPTFQIATTATTSLRSRDVLPERAANIISILKQHLRRPSSEDKGNNKDTATAENHGGGTWHLHSWPLVCAMPWQTTIPALKWDPALPRHGICRAVIYRMRSS